LTRRRDIPLPFSSSRIDAMREHTDRMANERDTWIDRNRYFHEGAVLAKRDAWARIAGCMREEAGSVVGSVIV